MRLNLLFVGSLVSASPYLAAQTEFGIDVCEYDYALMRQRVAKPDAAEAGAFCRDTTTNLDSALAAVYRRTLASLTDPVKRQAFEQSQQAFVSYTTAQERLVVTMGGDTMHVRRTMVRYRMFFLQRMLGEWTEIDEDAARASMKQDLRKLITAEEAFFADSVKYTPKLSALDLRPAPMNSVLSFQLTRDGWAATVGNAKTKTVCTVFIGSTPMAPARREREPVCH